MKLVSIKFTSICIYICVILSLILDGIELFIEHSKEIHNAIFYLLCISIILTTCSIIKRNRAFKDLHNKVISSEYDLKESEERYRVIFNTISNAIFLVDSKTEKIVDVNTSALVLYGYTKSEFLKLSLSDLVVGHDIIEVEKVISGELKSVYVYQRRKDKQIFPIEISLSSFNFKDYTIICCVCRDVSDRQNLEIKLHNQTEQLNILHERLVRLIDSIDIGIFEIDDRDYSIVLANKKALDILGLEAKDVIGKKCFDVICRVGNLNLCDIKDLKPYEFFQTEREFINCITNEKIPVLKTVTKISVNSHYHVIASFIDITLRKEQEIELRKLKSIADETSELKTQVIKKTAHEIGNLLYTFPAHFQIIEKCSMECTEISDSLKDLIASYERMKLVLSIMRDKGVLKDGIFKFNPKPSDFDTIVNNIVYSNRTNAIKKSISFTLDYHNKIGWVYVDYIKMDEVLGNLVGNAIKFTEIGYVNIKIDYTKIEDIYDITIIVEDTGIGIKESEKHKIFDIDVQGEGGKKYGGFGQGLSIVKQYLDMMGGKITLDSEYGKGTKFIVNLSLKKSPKIVDNQDIKTRQLRILVADDMDSIRSFLKRKLENYKHEVIIVPNIIELQEEIFFNYYDLVITDINMGNKDTIEIIKTLRKKGYKIPIIAMSGSSMSNSDTFNLWLMKPILESEIRNMLCKYADYMIPNIDLYKQEFDVDWKLIKRLTDISIVEFKNNYSTLVKILDTEVITDISNFTRLAHSLKGNMGTICMYNAHHICLNLERIDGNLINNDDYRKKVWRLLLELDYQFKLSLNYYEQIMRDEFFVL